MDLDKLKRDFQGHFTDGLVTIVGSGLSAAEGLPGMTELRDHLVANVPGQLDDSLSSEWGPIADMLEAGTDLETALHKTAPSPPLDAAITELTAAKMLESELQIIKEVISGARTLRLTRLLKYMLKPNTGLPVITTNYDRLVEVAGEHAGLGVDTLFVGQHIGFLDAKESALSFCRDYQTLKATKKLRFIYRERVIVLKPHGSLDWFLLGEEPVRCPYPLDEPRLIITPGLNKYQTGYDRPFDTHRERANSQIDKALRYLIIGYGFNDNHLQTHLTSQIRAGKPTLVLTHTLSSAAEDLLANCPSMTAVAADPDGEKPGTWIITNGKREFIPGPNLWDVSDFVREVFEP